ncbi:MAG: POTRA domain-containing protein [Thermoanaerobaculia bacterium]
MRRAALFLAALALTPGPKASATAPPPGLMDARIASLAFEGDAPPDTKSWSRLTDLTPGQTLSQSAIRRSLRNLFATRRFLDLSAEASPGPDGVRVVIRFVAAPRIRKLAINGKGIPEKGRLLDALVLSPGDLWAPDALEPLEGIVREHLRVRGYFEPTIAVSVRGDSEANTVDLVIDVGIGPQAVAGRPSFAGGLGPVGEERLRKEARQKEGKAYREVRALVDAERYEKFLREQGWGRAEVRWDRASYDRSTRRATPRYRVFVGPRVVLQVTGVPVLEVKKHPDSPWSRLEPPDDETVERFRRSLVQSYQAKGYAKAAVTVSHETTPEEEIISFVVTKGDRYAVGKVAVDGTKAVSSQKARSVVQTSKPGLFTQGRLVEGDLEADAGAILGLYHAQGFRSAKVPPPTVAPGHYPFTLDVDFRVTEGQRFVVASRVFTGNVRLTDAELRKGLVTDTGRPFSEEEVNADVATLGGRYQERGFPDARVDANVKFRPGADASSIDVDVTFTILEGEFVSFGKTIVRGYRRTRLSVIERELGSLEGKPFSLTRTLEMQRSLAALGVFSRADVQVLPVDPDSAQRPVVVTLTEGKPWSLLYGAGAEYSSASDPKFSPRVSLGVSYNNLFGRALLAGIDGLYSSRQSRFRVFLREPSAFNAGLPVSLQFFVGQDYLTGYSVKRRGVYLDTSKTLGEKVKALFRYQYELVQPSQDPGLGPDQRPNQENRISAIVPAISWDRRDDPISPTKGFLVTADVKYAFPLLAATAHFFRETVFAGAYHAFGPGSVLAVAARAGAIQPIGPCNFADNPTCQPNLEIPIPERLFAGGRTTHRAFGQDALGIVGQTVNTDGVGYGGNGLLLFNVEWRVQLVSSLGVALFFDDGNTWADWKSINFSELRPGAGLGLFYMTPVGPVRIDYGMKLDKKPGETLGVFNFSVGYAF